VIPLLAAFTAKAFADLLPSAAATRLLAASALAFALASSAVPGLLTLSALIRLPAVDAAGHLSRSTVAKGDVVSVPVAIAAGALLAVAATAATAATAAAGRAA
jgi:hypothetical protein